MSGPSVPKAYTPTGSSAADQNYQSLYAGSQPYASALPGQVVPGVQTQVNSLVNNPYASLFQSDAAQAGQIGSGQVAPAQLGASQSSFGAGNTALQAGNSILQAGFDPQSALYAQQYGQNQQQTNAINAQNGVSGTPYGAGLDAQSGQNFNLAWQNNQLGRENTALQGFGAANTTAQNDFAGGTTLGLGGLNTILQSGQMPYNTAQTIGNNNIGAYNSLSSATSGALSPSNSLMSDLAQYLGIGQSATSINQAGAAQQFQQGNSIFSGIGSILGDVLGGGSSGNMFGGGLFG